MKEYDILVGQLLKLLDGGSAHVSLDKALEGLTAEDAGKQVAGLPYTIWQLASHIHIAQQDMLNFSSDSKHQSPKWPEGYWVKETAPGDEAAWQQCIQQIKDDREIFKELVRNADLYVAFPHGEGQTMLLETLQLADHNAYHTAEIVVLRRLLGLWQ